MGYGAEQGVLYRRTRIAVSGQDSLLSAHSPNLFICFKSFTFVVLQSPAMNGLELAADNTTALPVLRCGSKLSSASNARSGHTPQARPCDRYDDRQRWPDVEHLCRWFSLTAEKLQIQAPQ